MNKLKRALLAVCLVLFALSTALFAVACGEEDTPPDDGGKTTPTTYTVTLDYNKDQGTVTLSPDADSNGKYAKDTDVTVEVTPKTEYEVKEVKVGGAVVGLTDNKYTFKVTGNVTVSVTFQDAVVTPPPTAESYTVTLDYNKDQGTVSLSPDADASGKYLKGTQVTVKVEAKTDFEVEEVKVGGTKVDLVEGKYTFEVTDNVTVSATFKSATVVPPQSEAYTVTLSYEEEQGSVKLSPAADANGKYAKDTVVTVEVTPSEHYSIKSVKAGSETLAEKEGKYSFTVTADVTVTIEFEKDPAKYDAKFQGAWQIGGTTENALVINEYEAFFNGEAVELKTSANGFNFTVTDDDGDSVIYTATLKTVLTDGGEKSALFLKFGNDKQQVTVYYLNSAVDYTYTFAADFVGNWAGTSTDNPISVETKGAYMTAEAGSVQKAIVLSYKAETLTYTLVFGSTEYSLALNKGQTKESDTLRVKNLSDTESTESLYIREKEAPPALLAAAYAGTYKHDDDVVVIDKDGTVTYNGTVVSISYLNDGSSLAFSVLVFQCEGYNYWLTPGEPFDDVVHVQNLLMGDNESYTRQHTAETYAVNYSAKVDGATYTLKANGSDVTAVAPKTEVTLSFTLKTGYLLEKLTVGGYDVTADLAVDGKTYTYTFPVLTDLAVVAEYKEAETFTVTVNVTGSENGTVALNSKDVEGNVYSYTERDTVVVTLTPKDGKALTSFKVGSDDTAKELSKDVKNGVYTFEITASTVLSVTFADKGATSCDPHIWGAFTVSTSHGQTSGLYIVLDATGIKVYKNKIGFAKDDKQHLWYFGGTWGEESRVETASATVNEDGSYTFTLTGGTVTYRVCYSETTGITYLESTSSTGTKTYNPMVRFVGDGSEHEFTAPENFIGEWKGISSTGYRIVIEANAFKSFTSLSSVLGEYEVLDDTHILVNGCAKNDLYCRNTVYLITLYKSGDYYEVKTELVGTTKMDDLTFDKVYGRNGEYTKFPVKVDMPEGQGAYSFSTEGDTFRGTVTLTIKPYGGYVIDTVTVDGEPVTPTSSNTVKLDVQKETEVKVTFKKVPAYSVTVENEADKGTVTFSPECLNGKLNENVQVKVTAKALDGWFVSKITVTGIGDTPQVSTSSPAQSMSLTVSKLTANITVKVEYTKAYTVEIDRSAITSEQGSVTSGGTTIAAGGKFTLTVTVKAGYMIDTFTVNGENKLGELVYDGSKFTYTVEALNKNLKIVVTMKEAPAAVKDAQVTIQNGETVVYDTTNETVTGKTQAYVVKFTLAAGTTAVKGGLYADVVGGNTTAQKTFEMFDPTDTGAYYAVVVFDKSGQKLALTNKSGAPITGSITSFEKYTSPEITELNKEYVVPVLYYNQNNAAGNYASYVKVKVASELLSNYYMTIGFTGATTTSITPCGSSYSAKLSTESSTSFTTGTNRRQVKLESSIFFVGSTGGFVTVKLEEIPTHKVTVVADEEALKSVTAKRPKGTTMADLGKTVVVDLDAVLDGATEITYTITPNTGWAIATIEGVLADGTTAFKYTYTDTATYKNVTMKAALTQDMTITVTFNKLYSITDDASGRETYMGTATFSPSLPVKDKTPMKYTITPKAGFVLDKFTINGANKTGDLTQENGKYVYSFTMTPSLDGYVFKTTFKPDPTLQLTGETGSLSLEKSKSVIYYMTGKTKGLYLLTVTLGEGQTAADKGLLLATHPAALTANYYTNNMYSPLDTGKYQTVFYFDGVKDYLILTAGSAADVSGTYSITPYTEGEKIDDGKDHFATVEYVTNSATTYEDATYKATFAAYAISGTGKYTVTISFPASITSSYTMYLLVYNSEGKTIRKETIKGTTTHTQTLTVDLTDGVEVRFFQTSTNVYNIGVKMEKVEETAADTASVSLPANLKSLYKED